MSPASPIDEAEVAAVLARVHQIGWQLRLGEHIESKQQMKKEQGTAPATPDELSIHNALLRSIDDDIRENLLEMLRVGTPGRVLNNRPYRLRPIYAPLENLGRPGYEAETRELMDLWEQMHADGPDGEADG